MCGALSATRLVMTARFRLSPTPHAGIGAGTRIKRTTTGTRGRLLLSRFGDSAAYLSTRATRSCGASADFRSLG